MTWRLWPESSSTFLQSPENAPMKTQRFHSGVPLPAGTTENGHETGHNKPEHIKPKPCTKPLLWERLRYLQPYYPSIIQLFPPNERAKLKQHSVFTGFTLFWLPRQKACSHQARFLRKERCCPPYTCKEGLFTPETNCHSSHYYGKRIAIEMYGNSSTQFVSSVDGT